MHAHLARDPVAPIVIELACITDSAYARHTGAMLHSALSCSAPGTFAVHVLHGAPIAADERGRLEQVAAGFRAALRFTAIPEAMAADFPDGFYPRSVWYRVLLPELLPRTDKVLYMDSDLIVTDDLGPLWDTALDDCLLGAVTNPFYPFMRPYPRLAFGIEAPDYFNSGVLLMNLAQMRAENTVAAMREFARRRPRSTYPDQDALNVTCRGRWRRLHPRWNAQSTIFELADSDLPLDPGELAEARAAPATIHFIGPFKPWHYLCRHPHQRLYFRHARATLWGAPELEGRTLRNAVLRRLPLAWIDRIYRFERRAARQWRRARRMQSLV